MKKISKYKDIISAGVTDEMSFSDRLSVELGNLFVIVAIPFCIIHIVFNFIGPNVTNSYYPPLIWFINLSIPLLLNFWSKPFLSRVYLAISSIALVGLSHFLHGSGMRLEPVYFLIVLFSAYFFQKRAAIFMMILTVSVYVGITYIQIYYTPPLQDKIVTSAPFTYFGVSIIFTIILSLRLIDEHKRFNQISEKNLKDLERKNEELRKFSYITSHDLKAPIRTIQSFVGLSERSLELGDIEKIKEYLQYIKKGGRELGQLVDDILDFAMIDQTQSYTITDLREVLSEVEESLKTDIATNNVTINIPDYLPKYIGIKRHFKMLFQNILQNAIKYNTQEKPIIDLTSEIVGAELVIKIKDNGIGIAEEYYDQIFDYFKRLHSNDTYEGSGIGLAICKKILDQYDGSITVDSQLDVGSVFTIRLPLNNQSEL